MATVLVALTEGVSALVLRVGGPDGVAPAELDRLLDGVFVDLVPVVVWTPAPTMSPPRRRCCRC